MASREQSRDATPGGYSENAAAASTAGYRRGRNPHVLRRAPRLRSVRGEDRTLCTAGCLEVSRLTSKPGMPANDRCELCRPVAAIGATPSSSVFWRRTGVEPLPDFEHNLPHRVVKQSSPGDGGCLSAIGIARGLISCRGV